MLSYSFFIWKRERMISMITEKDTLGKVSKRDVVGNRHTMTVSSLQGFRLLEDIGEIHRYIPISSLPPKCLDKTKRGNFIESDNGHYVK